MGRHRRHPSLASRHSQREVAVEVRAVRGRQGGGELVDGEAVVGGWVLRRALEGHGHLGGDEDPLAGIELVGQNLVGENTNAHHPRAGPPYRLEDVARVVLPGLGRFPERQGQLVADPDTEFGGGGEAQERLGAATDHAPGVHDRAVTFEVAAVGGSTYLKAEAGQLTMSARRPVVGGGGEKGDAHHVEQARGRGDDVDDAVGEQAGVHHHVADLGPAQVLGIGVVGAPCRAQGGDGGADAERHHHRQPDEGPPTPAKAVAGQEHHRAHLGTIGNRVTGDNGATTCSWGGVGSPTATPAEARRQDGGS